MNPIRLICIAALTLTGCSDATAPMPRYAIDGKWCPRVGTFPFPPSGGTITYENTTTYRDETMAEGFVFRVEVRGCKATVELRNR